MHLTYDVSAAFHFRLIQVLDPRYSGARTNLAVALARLGLSQEAYLTSFFAARDLPKSAIAQYNLAWFHNARGDYAGAAKSLALAFETLRTYDKALHLQALNEIEAGRTPPPESVAAVPKKERTRLGSIQAAAVFAPAGATLRDRDRVAGTTRTSGQFVVSDRQAPWIAVYWPDEVLKHRYWLHTDEVNAAVAAALTGVWRFKRDGKAWATARFQQENGTIRGSVEKNEADKLLRFNVDSVALDGSNVKMKIRYPTSGERATVNLAFGSNLRIMTGEAKSPSGGSTVVVAEKTP
jgi:tetratricopeptide (TPR) repeat protein